MLHTSLLSGLPTKKYQSVKEKQKNKNPVSDEDLGVNFSAWRLGISLWDSHYLQWESHCFISCTQYAPLDSHKIWILKLRPAFSEKIRLQENAQTTRCWSGACVFLLVYIWKGENVFLLSANAPFTDNSTKTLCPTADSHGCCVSPQSLLGTP